MRREPLFRKTEREGAEGRPGSQETCRRPKAHKPSWKGVGSMNALSRRMLLALAGAVISLVLAFSASAVAAPITVNLRVEGSTKTLFEGPVSTEAILPPGI